MERLMEIARRAAGKVVLFSRDEVLDRVSFENGELKDIDSTMQSGVSVILLKDGRIGSAYTRNLDDRERLVQDAVVSLRAGAEAGYDLPEPAPLPNLSTYETGAEKLISEQLVAECRRVCDMLAGATTGQLNATALRSLTATRVMNSRGLDVTARHSDYVSSASVLYPGSYASVSRSVVDKSFVEFPAADLAAAADLYNRSQRAARPVSGRYKVLFLGETMFTLVWRLTMATSGRAVYEKVSPLREKLGGQVLSDKLSLRDLPLDDCRPGARAFDDEGTPCADSALFEAGVLRGFYCDRYYAWKLGVAPTGHGYRGDVTNRPYPALGHIVLDPGTTSLAEMVRQMDRGIIVAGCMGAHSGNLMQGEYSIGLSPGLYVENGEVVGGVKDAMVAGNVYETMREVIAVEDRAHATYGGWFPAVLFDNVSFVAQG